jgi:hypothetical protein
MSIDWVKVNIKKCTMKRLDPHYSYHTVCWCSYIGSCILGFHVKRFDWKKFVLYQNDTCLTVFIIILNTYGHCARCRPIPLLIQWKSSTRSNGKILSLWSYIKTFVTNRNKNWNSFYLWTINSNFFLFLMSMITYRLVIIHKSDYYTCSEFKQYLTLR